MHRSPHPFLLPSPCAASIGTAQYRDRRGCFLWGDRPATCGSSRTAASALGYAGPRPRCIESIDGSLEPSRLHSVCCSILRPTQFCKPVRTPRRVRTSWEEGTIRLIVGYRASYSYGLAMVTHARKARPCSVCPPSFPRVPPLAIARERGGTASLRAGRTKFEHHHQHHANIQDAGRAGGQPTRAPKDRGRESPCNTRPGSHRPSRAAAAEAAAAASRSVLRGCSSQCTSLQAGRFLSMHTSCGPIRNPIPSPQLSCERPHRPHRDGLLVRSKYGDR